MKYLTFALLAAMSISAPAWADDSSSSNQDQPAASSSDQGSDSTSGATKTQPAN